MSSVAVAVDLLLMVCITVQEGAQARPPDATVLRSLPIPTVQAIAQDSSLVLAWSTDSLHVVKVQFGSRPIDLLSAPLNGAFRDTRVLQLVAEGRALRVRLSDRQTSFVLEPGSRRATQHVSELRKPEAVRLTHSVVGSTMDGAVLLLPILLPATNFGTEVGVVSIGDTHGVSSLDTMRLGRRIVQLRTPTGPSLLYDSPLRVLHDVSTKVALSRAASSLAVVDAQLSQPATMNLQVRLHRLGRGVRSTSVRRSLQIPIARVTQADRSAALEEAIRTMAGQFGSTEAARRALDSVVAVGDPIPPVQAIRATDDLVVVEFTAKYSERTRTERFMIVSAHGQCVVPVLAGESILAIDRRVLWTRGSDAQGRTYVRPYPVCL